MLDCQDAKALELALEAGQAGKIALEHTTQRLVEMGANPPRIPWGDYSQQQQSSSDQSRGALSWLDSIAAPPIMPMPPDVCAAVPIVPMPPDVCAVDLSCSACSYVIFSELYRR